MAVTWWKLRNTNKMTAGNDFMPDLHTSAGVEGTGDCTDNMQQIWNGIKHPCILRALYILHSSRPTNTGNHRNSIIRTQYVSHCCHVRTYRASGGDWRGRKFHRIRICRLLARLRFPTEIDREIPRS